MNTQPEALRLAAALENLYSKTVASQQAAAELRRLHAVNIELLEALNNISYGLEQSRIWGGMEWTYHPIHPFKYLPMRDKARAAITKATGEQA